MARHEPPMQNPSLRVTKIGAVVACVCFLLVVGLSSGPGSSIGIFCTWGVILFGAFISFIGYFACRTRGERVSVFYVICPVLLFGAFLLFLFWGDILRAL